MTNTEEINYTENYAWVDDRLRELYYGDDLKDTYLLTENYAWVDDRLRELYYGYTGIDDTEVIENLHYDYGEDVDDSDVDVDDSDVDVDVDDSDVDVDDSDEDM